MKKYILFFVIVNLICCYAFSQCNPAIPSNATVIDSTQTVNGGFTPAWVCAGDTLISNGGIFNVYMEPGSYMTTGGGIDTIFVKKGASFFMNGGIHYIYYEDNNDLNLAGGIPTLDSCPNMTFDYSNAPVNGCFTGPIAEFYSKDTLLCAGDCINFTNQSINAIGWQWTFQGAIPDTSNIADPQNICYNTAGNFDVTLIVNNGSGADTLTLTNYIHVYALPSVTITQNGNILTATPGYPGYQWYFGNIIINGANTNTFNAFQNGTYYVHVSDSNGCDSIVQFVYVNQGVFESTTEFPFIITPNPARDYLIIKFKTNLGGVQNDFVEMEISDVFGKKVLSQQILTSNTANISIQNFSSGIYFVKLKMNDKSYFQKVVVE